MASTAAREEFKHQQRAIWEAGDYPSLSELISDVGERVVGRAGVEPGMRVLDVACGTGNAAFPAARVASRVDCSAARSRVRQYSAPRPSSPAVR